MDWSHLRRIVTAVDTQGNSRIHLDAGPANILAVDEAGLAEIWSAELSAAGLLAGEDRLATEPLRLEPAPGSVKVRWFTVAPESHGDEATPAEREASAAMAFAAIGAAHARFNTQRHPMMHKTDTLDVIILVRGEVDLILDTDEVRAMKPGDVVIQRASNHAWVNRGAETALLVAILIAGSA